VIKIGGTRVTLDTIIYCFHEGATAEEISHQYPTLNLADIYFVLGYYLKNRPEVDSYLSERECAAKKIRKQNESGFEPHGIRARLLARQSDGEKSAASGF
jgi:uncharacterized protein (DUF433 family)